MGAATTSKGSDRGYFKHGRVIIIGTDRHSTLLKYISILWPKLVFISLLILYLTGHLPIHAVCLAIYKSFHSN